MRQTYSRTTVDNSSINLIIKIMLIIELIRMVVECTFFKVSTISVVLTAILTCCSLAGIFVVFAKKLSFFMRVLCICFGITAIISYSIHQSGLEYFCNTIIFLGVLAMAPYVKLKKNLTRISLAIYFAVTILVMLFAKQFGAGNTKDVLINLNTNGSGFILMICEFCLLGLVCVNKNHRAKRYCYLILFVVVFIFHIQFSGRSSLIGTALMLLYVIFKRQFDKSGKRFVRGLAFILCLGGVLFAYIYAVPLFEKIGHGQIYLMGKDIFTGRQVIWQDAFEQLSGNLLFGIGNRLQSIAINNDTSGFTNLHNQMMGWLTTYGIVVYILILLLIMGLLGIYVKKGRSKIFIAVTLILLGISYFDTILYSSANNPMVIIALILATNFDNVINKAREKRYAKNHSLLLVRQRG